MKIYFAASMRGLKMFGKAYETIYRTIDELGYKITDDLMVTSQTEDFYKELEAGGPEAYNEFYEKTIEKIKSSDINVFECSLPSLGIGFQVVKSLEFNKPTIVLYQDDHIPHFMVGSNEDRFIVRSYNNTNIKKKLKAAIDEARERADKRFNFFISPFLLSYLNKVARDQGITKSTFIRNLILEYMREKDNETK